MKDTLLWSVQCSKRKEEITRSTVQNQYRGGKTTQKLHFHLACHPHTPQTRVSNGIVQLFRTKGQKFLHCPGTKR